MRRGDGQNRLEQMDAVFLPRQDDRTPDQLQPAISGQIGSRFVQFAGVAHAGTGHQLAFFEIRLEGAQFGDFQAQRLVDKHRQPGFEKRHGHLKVGFVVIAGNDDGIHFAQETPDSRLRHGRMRPAAHNFLVDSGSWVQACVTVQPCSPNSDA